MNATPSFLNVSIDQKLTEYRIPRLVSIGGMIITAVGLVAIPLFKRHYGFGWLLTSTLLAVDVVVLLGSAVWNRFISHRLNPYKWTAQELQAHPGIEIADAAAKGAAAYGDDEPLKHAFQVFLSVPQALKELSWEEVVDEYEDRLDKITQDDIKKMLTPQKEEVVDEYRLDKITQDDIKKMLTPQKAESEPVLDEIRRKIALKKEEEARAPILFTITNLSNLILGELRLTFSFSDDLLNGRGLSQGTGGSLVNNVTAQNPLKPNQTIEIRASNLSNEYRSHDVQILALKQIDATPINSNKGLFVYHPDPWANKMVILEPTPEHLQQVREHNRGGECPEFLSGQPA